MPKKLAVCIASYKSDDYLKELLDDLDKQTFKDFKTYIVKDVDVCGEAKNTAVQKSLQDRPDYIQMIDADDRIEPTFLEEGVKRLEKGDIDWVICWGNLFGDRKGYIHSRIPKLNDLTRHNRDLHSWLMAKREVFEKCKFPPLDSGVDWSLWLQIFKHGFKGDIVKKELYHKRWHNKSVTVTRRVNREAVLKSAGLPPERKFRFHLPGLVHLPVSKTYIACAFTQKVLNLAKMLISLGHEVIIYGAQGSEVPCELVETHTLEDIRREWGEGDNRFEIGYNWKVKNFKHDFNQKRTETTKKYYNNCISEITKRKRDDDFLLLMQGQYQKPIADALNMYLTCEPGIGYRGSIKGGFRAFESSYLQNFTYGSENPFKSIDGSYYDRVISNYFDPQDFTFSDKKKDYYLYIGRMIKRKGVWTAIKATQAIGAKLILAGQPDPEIDVNNLPDHCEFVGFADVEKRKKLMSEAIATFTPTIYLEAFAGVHIESMLSGTPPITTNFAVFAETIPDYLNGKVGFRCNTLQDFVDAGRDAKKANHKFVRKYGERFLMDNVKLDYEKWFKELYNVYESTKGKKKGWSRLK